MAFVLLVSTKKKQKTEVKRSKARNVIFCALTLFLLQKTASNEFFVFVLPGMKIVQIVKSYSNRFL